MSGLGFFLRVGLWVTAAILATRVVFFPSAKMLEGGLLVIVIVAALLYSRFDKERFEVLTHDKALVPVPQVKRKGQGQHRYQVFRDTYYHQGTPITLVHLLDKLRVNYTNVRIYLAPEAQDETPPILEGYLGCSDGSPQWPMMVQLGEKQGPLLLDHRIMQIEDVHEERVLY